VAQRKAAAQRTHLTHMRRSDVKSRVAPQSVASTPVFQGVPIRPYVGGELPDFLRRRTAITQRHSLAILVNRLTSGKSLAALTTAFLVGNHVKRHSHGFDLIEVDLQRARAAIEQQRLRDAVVLTVQLISS
jgi:hypothetical protein